MKNKYNCNGNWQGIPFQHSGYVDEKMWNNCGVKIASKPNMIILDRWYKGTNGDYSMKATIEKTTCKFIITLLGMQCTIIII